MISLLSFDDAKRYFADTFVRYKGTLVIVSFPREEEERVHLKPPKGKNICVDVPSFCRGVSIEWPTAGFRRLGDGVYRISYRRDEYKKAPSLACLTVSAIKTARKVAPDYWMSVFNPVFDDEVLCHLAAAVGDTLYIGTRALRITRKEDTGIYVGGVDSVNKALISAVNRELGREFIKEEDNANR